MYKQRKNFSFLEFPSILEKKKEVSEAKISFIKESLNIDALNSLYQNKEIDKDKLQQKPENFSTVPSSDLKFKTLEEPENTEAELKKAYDGTLLLGISKPYKITFTDLQTQNPQLGQEPINTMSEEVKVLDDEVLAPLDIKEKEIEAEDSEAEKSEKDEKDNKPDTDYNFLMILPASEILPKEIIDAVNKAGQGVIKNPILKTMMEPPIPFGKNSIKSIEDDIQGYSVAGIENPIGIKLLNSKKI